MKTGTRHSVSEFDSSQEQDYLIDQSNSNDNRTCECKNAKANDPNGTEENSVCQQNDTKTNGISSKDSSDCIRDISTPYLQDNDEIQVRMEASSME